MKHKTELYNKYLVVTVKSRWAKMSLPLAPGNLLLRRGTTQPKWWLHSVPKRKHSGPRINVTFRFVKTRKGTENYYRWNSQSLV